MTRVCAGGGSPCGQERLFTYDNRGFLTSEKHPEIGPTGKGTVSYAYDARGNVLAKDIAGTADFDLRYRYGDANRLVGIDQATGAGELRPLKSFHYVRTNDGTDKRAGKLVRATRTNWVDIVDPISNAPGTLPVVVAQAYRYRGLDDRTSQRQTRYTFGGFHFAFDTGFAYDTLGNFNSLAYPECLNAAECPPGEAPDRTVPFNYTRGYLSGIPGYADSIYYYQLGGMLEAVEHANGVTETITHADSNLPRPKRIATTGVASGNWNTADYIYDGAGNIKAIGTQTYRYDRLNRMVRGELDTGDATRNPATGDGFGCWCRSGGP